MDKEKYTEMVGIRITKTQKDYLDDNQLNLRDVIDYHMFNNIDKRKRLLNREKYLLNKIDSLETDLENSMNELKDVRIQLGKTPTEDQETLDIMEAKELIIQRCQSKWGNKLNKIRIEDYLEDNESTRVLQPILVKYNIKNVDDFKKELLKRINLE